MNHTTSDKMFYGGFEMYKRNTNDTQSIRLFSVEEGAAYMGIGKTAFRAYAVKIGAVRRIGRRVLYDKHILDSAIDKMSSSATAQ